MAVDPKSKTAKNLAYAFAGEAQARTKYNYYASKARKEGFEQIAAIFEATANNEKEHAKLWFEELHGIGTTLENLADAAAGEHEEWIRCTSTAEEAKAEGYDALAKSLKESPQSNDTRKDKKTHRNIKTGEVWARTEKLKWECRNCGHIHYGAKAPKICPACNHPQAFFEIEAENY